MKRRHFISQSSQALAATSLGTKSFDFLIEGQGRVDIQKPFQDFQNGVTNFNEYIDRETSSHHEENVYIVYWVSSEQPSQESIFKLVSSWPFKNIYLDYMKYKFHSGSLKAFSSGMVGNRFLSSFIFGTVDDYSKYLSKLESMPFTLLKNQHLEWDIYEGHGCIRNKQLTLHNNLAKSQLKAT